MATRRRTKRKTLERRGTKRMSRTKECDCVQCPQGCIHCGRELPYTMVRCDWCGQHTVTEDKFEEEGWHRVRAVGKYRGGESQPKGYYELDMCSDCHEQAAELLIDFDSVFDEFVNRVKTYSQETVGKAVHDSYVGAVKEWLGVMASRLDIG